MAAAKPDLSRAGTMQVTAKEGANFLNRNLTEWKKPYLTDHLEGDEKADEDAKEEAAPAAKTKLSKHTTMKATAKDAEAILDDLKPDEDALTRSQAKRIEEIYDEVPEKSGKSPAKKAKLSKANTMKATAKEGKALLKGEKLEDTRQETAAKQKYPKRTDTISQTKAEAEALVGEIPQGEGYSLRKRPEQPKQALKKAGTMQQTAKEGKAFLKRSKKAAKKNADVEEDE